MADINEHEFSLLKAHLNSVCGIDVPPEKRYLFKTRLRDVVAEEGCRNFADLYRRLTRGKDRLLQRRVVQAMTTHESSFFRDRHPFETFKDRILPEIAERKLADDNGVRQIRIFSCGCSAGQEPYSIAICIKEWLETQTEFKAKDITVFGTDISREILKKAATARYTQAELGRFMPAAYLAKYFTEKEGQWELAEEIRRMVKFAELNLAETISFIGKFDMIFCRNVIIYFSPDLKRRIVEQFRHMLLPGGVLMLGASESLYRLSDDYTTVCSGQTTYYMIQ